MIQEIQNILKQLGERDIMWNNAKTATKKKGVFSHKLSRTILGIFWASFFIAIVSLYGLNDMANRLLLKFVETNVLALSEYELIDWQYAILGLSIVASILIFVFLALCWGVERLAYIGEIIKGIDALGCHEWSYEIPLQGENELTELAIRVNALSKEEQAFREKEKQLQEEKNGFIRSLSHDIRTPLTSVLAYSEFMKQKEYLSAEEMRTYMELVEQKSRQMKVLTDRLLDGGNRQLEFIENGSFLMEQLVDEWSMELEEDFLLEVDMMQCPKFSGEVDIQELRRIFDNLASNIRKYAQPSEVVTLQVLEKEGRICIVQSNTRKIASEPVESNGIGVESIRKIAMQYGGRVEVLQSEQEFSILISLWKSNYPVANQCQKEA